MIDVRDVAEVHERIMRPGRGPRRYVCGGTLLTFDEMIDALELGLGRRIRRIPVPVKALLAAGRLTDLAGRFVSLSDGLSYEAAMLLTAATPTDDTATLRDLQMTWRPPQAAIVESFRDGADAGRQQLGDPLA